MAETAIASESVVQHSALYQEARWPGSARLLYVGLLSPFWLLAARDVVWPATTRVVGLCLLAALVVFTAACEWRARKMGLVVTSDGVVLIRALNRTRIRWADIEDFEAIPFGMWGEQRVRVKRHHRFGGAQPAVPTLILTPTRSWWTWWFRPARLRAAGTLQDDPLDFLRGLLRADTGRL